MFELPVSRTTVFTYEAKVETIVSHSQNTTCAFKFIDISSRRLQNNIKWLRDHEIVGEVRVRRGTSRVVNETARIVKNFKVTRCKATNSATKLKKHAVGLCIAALFLLVTAHSAYAYSVTDDNGTAATTKTITNEAIGTFGGDEIAFFHDANPAPAGFAAGDTLEISLSGGATFADANMVFEGMHGGAGNGDLTWVTFSGSPQGKSSISLTIKQGTNPASFALFDGLVLSGDTFAGQNTNFNLPQIAGRDIFITFTLRDSGGTLKATVKHKLFDNTLAPAGDLEESQSAIKSVIGTHIRNITSQSVGLSGLLTGRGFGRGGGSLGGLFGDNAAFGNALAESTGLTLPVDMELNEGRGSFAANLNSVMNWTGELAAGEQNTNGLPPSQFSNFESPMNLWVKGRWEGITDSRGGTTGDSDFGLFMTGVDYRLNKNTMIGVLGQYDLYKSTATGQNSQGKGHGWMVGPYMVSRLDENLIWDGRVAWGRSKNKINPLGRGWDKYDGERSQVETNLTGDIRTDEWEFYPQIGLNYFREEQKSYTNFGGERIDSQTISYGNLTFGPEIVRVLKVEDGPTYRPFVALRGIWDFQAPPIEHANGSQVDTEKLRAKAEFGGDITFADGGSIYAKYAYDGIGLANYSSHSFEVIANTPVTLGFLPDNTQLKSSFNQAMNATQTSTFRVGLDIPLN
ncbi:autotransporter outer membrane beta-barrel domain-containing protein [Thalassospira povalilytica]|uniref:Autotransporter outer membrane beta-barrel domain-containing protein n=1 Tax=Thalassospira povalilytica TaxID=732237 RepID=A0A8I1M9Q3_9PROT|nr:autotransporter outer membrane beta-barrel domain-containing protein [Thalassospira povalilytica]MBN8197731.1 autotransporter outer membrane beta-barrel domain-containing protein [Thalassospira povalilytica]